MARRVTILALAAGLLSLGVGCRHCGDPCRDRCGGWFSSRSARSACSEPNGRLVGRGSCETCIDPATGMPMPGYDVPATLIPGSAGIPGAVPGGPPDMLPYPSPSPLIPPAGVPFAPPGPAPGGTVGTLPAPRTAIPLSGR